MELQAKPDSSHASIRLTRKNGPRKSLLSTFRNKNKNEPSETVKRDSTRRKDSTRKKAPEPGVYDAPVSSSEENETGDDDVSLPEDTMENVKRFKPARKTLEEKLVEDNNNADGTAEQKGEEPNSLSRRGKRRIKSEQESSSPPKRQQGPLKKTLSGLYGGSDDEETLLFSSQSPLRPSKTYGSSGMGKFRRGHPGDKGPRKNAPSSAESSRLNKNRKNSSKEGKEEEGEESGFKVPMEIDIGSPVSKAQPGTSPNPEFKQPPSWPNDTISSSSLATSSTKDHQLFDINYNSSSSSLSSPPSSIPSIQLDLTQEEEMLVNTEESPTDPTESLCPMCKQKVDPDLLRAFMSQPRRRVRDQQRFCESHKRQSAQLEWKDKAYPTIDWEAFDDRIDRHMADLEKLLVPDSSSYYRNILDSAMKSGKARNFRLSLSGDGLETISCGYYGSRGASKMYFLSLPLPGCSG